MGLLIWGAAKFLGNLSAPTAEATSTSKTNVALGPQASAAVTLDVTETDVPSPTRTSVPLTQTTIPITPTLGIGSKMISDKDGMTLLYVPAGEFTMGSNDGGTDSDRPAHTVYLDAFWIDQTEVTNKMYASCVSTGICLKRSFNNSRTHPDYYSNPNYANYPVIYVDWNQAKTYCEWVGRKLPTEAQWEKAARGTDARKYPWGNNYNDKVLNSSGLVGDTTQVGNYPRGASPYGAMDMAGNVEEWTADWYSETYYSSSPRSNPFGPNTGTDRVTRGGSWEPYSFHEIWHRDYERPYFPSNSTGFRCAMSANP